MKRIALSPVSPCRTYSLAWDSKGDVEICLLETGDCVVLLMDNYRPVRRAAFSRDMRRILAQNCDGSVCVWSMPPRRLRADCCSRNIVEYLNNNYNYPDPVLRRLPQ